MMTIDDEGEGGLAKDDVITETPNFWQIFGIFRKIFQNFPKLLQISDKLFKEIPNFSRPMYGQHIPIFRQFSK